MVDWTGKGEEREGISARPFAPAKAGGDTTAVMYETQRLADDAPLVLMQHGGSSHKMGADVWDLAQALVGRGVARLVALDGPVHGARCPGDPDDALAVRARFFDLWASGDGHVQRHVDAWQSLLDELLPLYRPARLAWVGLSMGTAYGVPLLARERRIGAAVVGMWGNCFANSMKLVEHAQSVNCRILFQQKWGDQLFTREGQLRLFDAIASTDKRLHVYLGGHARVEGEQMGDLVHFVRTFVAPAA